MHIIEPRSEGCKEERTFDLVPFHELGNCIKKNNKRNTYSKVAFVFINIKNKKGVHE